MADQEPAATPSGSADPAASAATQTAAESQALKAVQEAIAAAKAMQTSPPAAAAAPSPVPAAAPSMVDASAGAKPFTLPNLGSVANEKAPEGIDLLGDVNLQVKIELGRTKMLVEDVLRLCEGSVVELDKLAGDPVDVYVNDRPVARGEVLVLNDNFCVRINEILSQAGDVGGGRAGAA